jgi:hypothetical protein
VAVGIECGAVSLIVLHLGDVPPAAHIETVGIQALRMMVYRW